MFFYKKSFYISFILFYFSIINIIGATTDKRNEKIAFFSSIKTLSTDYKQTEYTDKGDIKANGRIIIKKPDKVLLEYSNDNTNLKIVSINDNLKFIDSYIGQTTYIENQYNELLKFLIGQVNNEKLYFNEFNELCLDFKYEDILYSGCIDIDEKQEILRSMNLYAKIVLKDKTERIAKVMSLQFDNLKINEKIEDDVFYIKDARIFDDDED